jgi:hypothetical protein
MVHYAELALHKLQAGFFEQPLKLELAFDLGGNFQAGIAGDDPNRQGDLVAWTIPDVMRLELDSIALKLADEVFYTEINGGLVPLFFDGADVTSSADSDPRIPVNGLRIGSDGAVSLDGGWVTLPEKRYIDFNGFRIELSAFGFGSEVTSPTTRWIGFSGGVELVEGLSSSAKFEKLQVKWRDGEPGADLALQGVEVAFEEPSVVAFRGVVDWFEEPTKKGFAGLINAELKFIKTSIDARLVIGETIPAGAATAGATCQIAAASERFKFFYLDVGATLPTGIPVFSGISLYGLQGLLALGIEPNICAFETALVWYAEHESSTDVVSGSPAPWSPTAGAFGVGLGVVLGTTPDDGFAVNAKVALTVAIPGPVVILSGAGNVLKQRGPLSGGDDPLFTAIAVFDGRELRFLINLGVYYRLPDSGLLMDVSANAEAFFDLGNPSNWHVYMGQDTPEGARVRATLLQFFTATSYHMLENDRTKFGASAGYDSRPDWKFGPLRVTFGAWAGFDTAISWRPVHAWGAVDLGGIADLKAFGFGVGLSSTADLAAESPSPHAVEGQFKVKLKLPWPLPDPEATVKFRWAERGTIEPVPDWIEAVSLEDSKTGASFIAPLEPPPADENSNNFTLPACSAAESLPDSLRDGPGCAGAPLVELTYRPVVAFRRDANNDLPANDPEQAKLVPVQPGHYADAFGQDDTGADREIRYGLTGLRLLAEKRDGSDRTSVFDADSPMDQVYGAWPALLGLNGQPSSLYVRLWSKNPFSVYDASTYQFYDSDEDGIPDGSWEEWFSGIYQHYPCADPYDADVAPDRCAPPGIFTEEDLVLPPYHTFALDVEGVASGSGEDVGAADYHRYAYFYTEGPPLALDSFVYNTSPGSAALPHYRDYAVGLRFNETYLDLLYKDPGPSDADNQFKDPAQLFTVDIIDEDEVPVTAASGAPFTVDTSWSHAPDHIRTRSEEQWIDHMVAKGTGLDVGLLPLDDMVYGQPTRPEVMRAGQRYTARFWLEDPRLATDTRVADPVWKAAMGVRFAEGDTALLYSFPFVASAYASFSALMATYEALWHPLPAGSFPQATVEAEALAARARATDGAAAANNADAGYLGRSLARLLLGRPPESLRADEVVEALRRVPNYVGDPEAATDAERTAILAAWSAELAAFNLLDTAMVTERRREPLPERVEVSVVESGGVPRALLIEAPEALNWARIDAELDFTASGGWPTLRRDVAVVANATGERAFVFDLDGGVLNNLADGRYTLTLTFRQKIGSRNTILISSFHPADETATLVIELPDGRFSEEAP